MSSAGHERGRGQGAAPDRSEPSLAPLELALLVGTTGRRTFLGRGLFAAGGFALGYVLARPRPGRRAILACPPIAPGSPRPLASLCGDGDRPALRLFAVGDIGWDSTERQLVLEEFRTQARARAPDLVLLLGDNFYRDGVSSTQDEQWRTGFEELFPERDFPCEFRACLGNHDHNGDIQAQVDYTRLSSRWRMPGRYYTFERPVGANAAVQFFVLDTQPIWRERASEQLAWLDGELGRSSARWKIVMGHHCIRSGGEHGPMRAVARAVEPLLERHKVDLYLSGHDHDLQLLRTEGGWLQLIAGTGSSLRDTGWIEDTLFAASKLGFAALSLTNDELRIELCAVREGPIFMHRITKRSAVLACEQAG